MYFLKRVPNSSRSVGEKISHYFETRYDTSETQVSPEDLTKRDVKSLKLNQQNRSLRKKFVRNIP